jgi:mycothiol synthase
VIRTIDALVRAADSLVMTTGPFPPNDHGLSVRPYAGPQDHAEMVRVRNAALRANGQPADATVAGIDAKYANLQQDLARDCTLVVVGNRIVAYARASAEDLTSGQRQAAIIILADPSAPELSAGVEMVFSGSLRRAIEQLEQMGDDRARRILCSFPAADEASRTAAERAGFREARRETVLVRENLAEIPASPLPEGFAFAPVDPSDRSHQRRVFDAASRAASDRFGALESADDWFGATLDAPGFDPSLWRVAIQGGDIAGVALNGLDEPGGEGSRVGWTELLAVETAYRKTGLAGAILADSLRGFRVAGATSAAVIVDLLDRGQEATTFTSLGYRIASATLEYLAGPFEPGISPKLEDGRITTR